MSRPFVMNPNNPWLLCNGDVAILMVHGGLSWGDLHITPPRVLINLAEYLTQTGDYKPKPKPTSMDISVPPDEFRRMVRAKRNV